MKIAGAAICDMQTMYYEESTNCEGVRLKCIEF